MSSGMSSNKTQESGTQLGSVNTHVKKKANRGRVRGASTKEPIIPQASARFTGGWHGD